MPRPRPCILLADPSETDSLEFSELLQLYNYEVVHCCDAEAALQQALRMELDAAVISLELLDGGFALSRQLLAIQWHHDLPLAFVTTQEVDEALLMEAQFYDGLFLHRKPYNHCELLAQISSLVRIKVLQDQLKDRMQELDTLASTDTLTGLYNRRLFYMRLEEELARAMRNNSAFCLLYIDLDFFKQVNDTYGHAVGDAVLQHISDIMTRSLRKSDVLGRVGGEEFCILLPDTPAAGGQVIAERLRKRVAAKPVHYEHVCIPTTVSIGLLAAPSAAGYDLDRLMRLADEALYAAKHKGRNRVEAVFAATLQRPVSY